MSALYVSGWSEDVQISPDYVLEHRTLSAGLRTNHHNLWQVYRILHLAAHVLVMTSSMVEIAAGALGRGLWTYSDGGEDIL
jgi:hypothetical protein